MNVERKEPKPSERFNEPLSNAIHSYTQGKNDKQLPLASGRINQPNAQTPPRQLVLKSEEYFMKFIGHYGRADKRLPRQPNEDRRLFRVVELTPATIMRTTGARRKFHIPATYHARAGICFRSHSPVRSFTGMALGSRAFGCIR